MHEGAPGLTQQRVREHLRDACGYEISGRATVEGNGELGALIDHLRQLLDIIEEAPGGGVLDHLWVYLDTPDYDGDVEFEH
jgi:hypothetical protein